MPIIKAPTTGGGAWSLVSYSTASAANNINVASLDLATDLRYKVIIEMDGNTSDSPYMEINGISTSTYYQFYQRQRYNSAYAILDTEQRATARWAMSGDSINSIMAEINFSLLKYDGTNERVAMQEEAYLLGMGANSTYHVRWSAAGFESSQSNLTSLKFTTLPASNGNFNWKCWVLKPATS